ARRESRDRITLVLENAGAMKEWNAKCKMTNAKCSMRSFYFAFCIEHLHFAFLSGGVRNSNALRRICTRCDEP
ncbi:MAG TPA: hypothetical protein VHK01_20455, partial [Lacipirellulaceae bacterium]|nr:hypothetical protein [Lacipirellulaceae bacterium]